MTEDNDKPIARLPDQGSSDLATRSMKALVEASHSQGKEGSARLPTESEAEEAYSKAAAILRNLPRGESGEVAASLLLVAAERGHAQAQFVLGLMRDGAWGARINHDEQVEWLERSASLDHVNAAFALGMKYEKGDDYLIFDRHGYRRTNPSADVRRQNPELAIHWYEKAAALGNDQAKGRLGAVYYALIPDPEDTDDEPDAITEIDRSTATIECIRWYMDSASSGDAESAFFLGKLYLNGNIIPPDKRLASRWLRNAVAGGHEYALTFLAEMLLEGGRGSDQFEEGVALLRTGVERDYEGAILGLAQILVEHEHTSKEFAEGLGMLRRAADRSNGCAQYELGRRYLRGEGVRQDRLIGIQLLLMSAEQDYGLYSEAHKLLTRALATGEILQSEVEHSTWWNIRDLKIDYDWGPELDEDGKLIDYLSLRPNHLL